MRKLALRRNVPVMLGKPARQVAGNAAWKTMYDRLGFFLTCLITGHIILVIFENAWKSTFPPQVIPNKTKNKETVTAGSDESKGVPMYAVRLRLHLNQEPTTLFTLNYTGIYNITLRFTASMLKTQLNKNSVMFGLWTKDGIQQISFMDSGRLNVHLVNVILQNNTRIRIGYSSIFVLPSPVLAVCYYGVNVTILVSGLRPQDLPLPYPLSQMRPLR